ncbi:MAG: LacI family DNA-binding transcriptional regulator [Bacteroidetes bacterium]|nr:LacI family DNA-binding transcriptional regulator [Bacteroidota bacterium]
MKNIKKQKSTIKDIALLAGVSETTVSLSFQPESRISEITRSKVLAIAAEINYSPNAAARGLRSGRTKTIGFLINDITNPFYGSMIRRSELVASNRGFEVIFSESQWDPDRASKVVSKMIQSRIEGIILCFSEKNENTYHLVQQSGLPHVAVDTIPTFYSGSYILNDGYNTGYLAAQHLCTTGCKHIAVVNAWNDLGDFSSIRQMERGFNLYLEEQQFPAKNCIVIKAGLTIDSGKQAYKELEKSGIQYDGIFCMNDLCAMGFMHESNLAGIIPGRDYAIIGVDNNDVSDLAMISLSSIYIDYDEIAEKATNYLIDQIDGKVKGELKKIVKPRLIERSSTTLFRQ